jgi:phosphate uptake regulator
MAREPVLESAEKLQSDVHQMCQQTVEMLKLTWEGFKTQEVALLQRVESLGLQLHQREKTLTTLAVQQSGKQTGVLGVVQELFRAPVDLERKRLDQQFHQQEKAGTSLAVRPSGGLAVDPGLVFIPLHLERIGDNIALIVRALTSVVRDGIPFTERALEELHTLFAKAIELLECIRDAIATHNRILIRHVQTAGQRYGDMVNEYALSHQQRLIEGLCLPRASSVYVALLDYLKGVVSHICQITDKLSLESAC